MTKPTISLEDQAAACERELKMRRRVYPRWVADNRMTQAKADAEKGKGDLFGGVG